MYLLGIDIGTSGTKSAVFNEEGVLAGQAYEGYVFDSLRPGYAEQDPEVWWKAVVTSVRKAVRESGAAKEEIAAIGFSGQMHGLIPVDRNGKVLHKAILHCDLRASDEAEEIRKNLNGELERIIYNPVFPGFQAISLYWLKKHMPDVAEQTFSVLCPKDYIRFRMTGNYGTDHSDASGTLFYDMEKCCWSDRVFKMLGLDRGVVPERIGKAYDVDDVILESAADELGLARGTKVVFGGADQAMQSLGNGIVRPGVMMATIGTSGQVQVLSDRPVFNPDLNTHTFRHVEDRMWFSLGAVLFAGSTLGWFGRNLGDGSTFEEMSHAAAAVTPGCDGLMFFPCMGGERTPYLDPKAKGAFIGMTMMHTRAHFVRAVMEGVAFEMKASIDIIENLYGKSDQLVCAGGGVKGDVWAQIQADVYGREIHISGIKEQACLGAAMAAGIGAGAFGGTEEACAAMCGSGMRVIEPDEKSASRYEGLYDGIYRHIYENNAELFHSLDKLA